MSKRIFFSELQFCDTEFPFFIHRQLLSIVKKITVKKDNG